MVGNLFNNIGVISSTPGPQVPKNQGSMLGAKKNSNYIPQLAGNVGNPNYQPQVNTTTNKNTRNARSFSRATE